MLGYPNGRKKQIGASGKTASRGGAVVLVANRTSSRAVVSSADANDGPQENSSAPDPEAQRIQNELTRLHDDTEARRAFYDDLRRTVQQVRAGINNNTELDEPKVAAPRREPSSSDENPGEPSYPPSSREPRGDEPKDPDAPRASLDIPSGESIDHDAYLRVVRWAKANGTPVQLALGVAWMESHLRTNPARGAAGEVGMFQIMPTRCTLEGWPARRLNEPEFNAWMGTMLLARYYRQEGSMARAAAMYVAGPGVFGRKYSRDMRAYINWYASTVDSYASYFSRYQS